MKASQEQLRAFSNAVDSAIAAAQPKINNDGPLWQSLNRHNWRTATFTSNAPELDANIRPHALFAPDEPVAISLEHDFNPRGDNDFVWHIRPVDEAPTDDPSSRALGAVSWLHRHGNPRFFLQKPRSATDITEATFAGLSADLVRSRVLDVDQLLETRGVCDALTLAVLRLREQSLDEMTTREAGEKTFANSGSPNGFNLEAYRFDVRHTTEPSYSLAVIALRRSFNQELYGGICRGILSQEISVREEAGKPLAATKESRVSLMNNPFIDSSGNLNAYANIYAGDDDLPEPLKALLFPGSDVTTEDLDHFVRLATEPLTEKDVDVALE